MWRLPHRSTNGSDATSDVARTEANLERASTGRGEGAGTEQRSFNGISGVRKLFCDKWAASPNWPLAQVASLAIVWAIDVFWFSAYKGGYFETH